MPTVLVNLNHRGSAQMNEYTKEQFEQVPDFMKDDFVLDGEVYKHAGVVKMKSTLNDLNGKLESQKQEYSSLNERLSSFEQAKAQEIEEAKKQALEQAKSKGEVADIEAIYKQQMEDLEKRTYERAREELTQEYTQKELKAKAEMDLKDLVHGLKPKDKFAERLIADHLKGRQRIEDGKIIYFNEDGSASSLDKDGLLKELSDSPIFKPLTSYQPTTTGGGNANGNVGGSAANSSTKARANILFK